MRYATEHASQQPELCADRAVERRACMLAAWHATPHGKQRRGRTVRSSELRDDRDDDADARGDDERECGGGDPIELGSAKQATMWANTYRLRCSQRAMEHKADRNAQQGLAQHSQPLVVAWRRVCAPHCAGR